MLNLIRLVQFALFVALSTSKRFEYHSFDQIYSRLVFLSKSCSRYIQLDTSQHRYGLDSAEPCILNETNHSCDTHIVYMTDFATYDTSRPQLYISGLLHGDEVIGPNVILEFIEYFCQNGKPTDSLEANLLRKRLFIFTPITNTYGFSHSVREDKVVDRNNKTVSFVDPNRDFPDYSTNVSAGEECLRSVSARTVNEIFKEHIILASISFQGGFNALAYPLSAESPDYNAFNIVSELLANYSDSDLNKEKGIAKYIIANISELPVRKGLLIIQ